MLAFRCIRLVVAFAFALVFASTASAQSCGRGYAQTGNFVWSRAAYGSGGFAGIARSGTTHRANVLAAARNLSRANMLASANPLPSSSPSEPSFDSMYGGMLVPTPWQLERQRKLQLAAERRDEVKSRREKSRAAIPVRIWSEEQLAQSKFQVAHLLYQDGNIDAAKNVLTKLLDDYPDTVTADRAKLTLAKL